MYLHPELLQWHYFERTADLNRENLIVVAHKPELYQPSEDDFKPGFKEKIRFF